MLRPETKVRARALQLLYAWDIQDRSPMAEVAHGVLSVHGGRGREWGAAENLATEVASTAGTLDGQIAAVADHWRMSRIGVVERNILRIGMHELSVTDTPAPVIISEALRLAHWFAGPKSVPFVNGVLDTLARQCRRL